MDKTAIQDEATRIVEQTGRDMPSIVYEGIENKLIKEEENKSTQEKQEQVNVDTPQSIRREVSPALARFAEQQFAEQQSKQQEETVSKEDANLNGRFKEWEKNEFLNGFVPKENETMADAVQRLANAFIEMKSNTKTYIDVPKNEDGYKIDTSTSVYEDNRSHINFEVDNMLSDDEIKELKNFGVRNNLTQSQMQALYDSMNQTRYVDERSKLTEQLNTQESFFNRFNINDTDEEVKKIREVTADQDELEQKVTQRYKTLINENLDAFRKGCEYFCKQLFDDAQINARKMSEQLIRAIQKGVDVSEVMYALKNCIKATRSTKEITENAIRYGASVPQPELEKLPYKTLVGMASDAMNSGRKGEAERYMNVARTKLI